MRVETRKGRFWSRLIRPLLWPTLAAQSLLVVLCLIVGLTGWWLIPARATWSLTFWLLLALLVGSSLNVAVFLLLLRQRLQACETGLEAPLARVETALAGPGRELSGGGASIAALADASRPLRQRLEAASANVEALIGHWRAELAASRDAERRLADELQAQRSRLERLEAGRTRAREESRLKSDYLVHLQQTLAPLVASADRVLTSDALARGSEAHAAIQGLRERLADTTLLLEKLGDGAAEAGERAPLRARRVLIVDDGPVNLMLTRQVLERQGLWVATATSGAEALALLAREPFDLIFMDIFMADMDGVATCRAWREHEAALSRAPRSVVVALTANAGEADRRRFREAGMDDVLAKPYRPEALLQTLQRWLPGVLETEARP